MSILIKGMDMPKDCTECRMVVFDRMGFPYCSIDGETTGDCPMVEIPQHVDLIDRNRLIINFNDWWYSQFGQEENEVSLTIREAIRGIEEAPTVIKGE